MKSLSRNPFYCKSIIFIALAMLGTFCASAQSKEKLRELVVDTEESSDNDTVATKEEKGKNDQCCLVKKNSYSRFIYADLGGSAVFSSANDVASSANGLSWAFGIQEAYKIKSENKKVRMFLSAGAEIRNYNAIASETDRFGGTAYNNLHYWYAGIPVIFQCLGNQYKPGKSTGWSHYGLASLSLGVKVRVNNAYSMQGNTATYDISEHYTTFLLQPMLSAGCTYKTPSCVYMFGPYVGYTTNNLITNTGISENIFSYGIRFSTMFLNREGKKSRSMGDSHSGAGSSDSFFQR